MYALKICNGIRAGLILLHTTNNLPCMRPLLYALLLFVSLSALAQHPAPITILTERE